MPDLRNWDPKIGIDFFNQPGRHLGIFGHSGVGKTQSAFWVVAEMINRGEETLVWFDTGKSSDLLRLLDFEDIVALIPSGCDITVKYYQDEYKGHITKKYFASPEHAFNLIEKGKINILMLRPFLQNSEQSTIETTEFFSILIDKAARYELPVPMSFILDEIQYLAPSEGHEFSKKQKSVTVILAHNIDQLRSWGIRIIGVGQDWGRVHRAVRSQFKCLLLRQGVFFYSDAPRLAAFNKTWEMLGQDQMIFVFSDRYFSDPMYAPFYGDGDDIGQIRYILPKRAVQEIAERMVHPTIHPGGPDKLTLT
jgi:hypothetical protein